MSDQIDPLERAFDALKSHGAILSESFSHRLEDRIMQEQQKQPGARHRSRVFWATIALVALLGGTVASYAATEGFRVLPWSVYVDEDGIVTDADGGVIGFTVDNDDGSETTLIQMEEGHMEVTPVDPDESLRGKGLGIVVDD